MRRAFYLSTFDAIVMAFFALLAAGSLVGLKYGDYLPLLSNQKTHNHFRMGKITSISNDVRKKMVNETHWTALKEKGDVFHKQMIFTSADSRTKIRLENDSEVVVEPESLVLFLKEGSRETLELKSGGLSGSFNDLAVIHKGKAIKLNSKASKIRVTDDQVKIEHQDKEARIHAPEISLVEQENLYSNEIELLPLERKYFLVEGEEVQVKIKWRAKKASDFILKWKKSGEEKVVDEKALAGNEHTLTFKAPGMYIVSLSDAKKPEWSSNELLVEIADVPRVKILNPLIEREL